MAVVCDRDDTHGRRAEQQALARAWWEVERSWEDSWAVSYKLNILLPYGPLTVLLGNRPKELKTHVHTKPARGCLHRFYSPLSELRSHREAPSRRWTAKLAQPDDGMVFRADSNELSATKGHGGTCGAFRSESASLEGCMLCDPAYMTSGREKTVEAVQKVSGWQGGGGGTNRRSRGCQGRAAPQ